MKTSLFQDLASKTNYEADSKFAYGVNIIGALAFLLPGDVQQSFDNLYSALPPIVEHGTYENERKDSDGRELHPLSTRQNQRWTKLLTIEELPRLEQAIRGFARHSSFYFVETSRIHRS